MPLKLTPLNGLHKRAGAKMVEFAGWEMPVQYEGVVAEHMAVRTSVGVFDVSHMGEVFMKGGEALSLIQRLACNDASKLSDGQAQYSALTTERGTFVDDILVHKFADGDYFLCVNAGTTDKDFQWIKDHAIHAGGRASPGVEITNRSADYAQIAVQGPRAVDVVRKLTKQPLDAIKYYRFVRADVNGEKCILARTGYTGEDGFEIYVASDKAEKMWDAVMNAGAEFSIKPCGLAARDTLRLEAGMCLYGNDMDESVSVLEADLGWILKLDKGDFIGRAVLAEQKEKGVGRVLAAFEMIDAGIARHGYDVYVSGEKFGQVTSGTHVPFLKKAIGLAYLPPASAAPGTEFEIDLRGRRAKARVIEKPPYKRKK